jgi:hypothetical protein
VLLILPLLALWAGLCAYAVRRWQRAFAVTQRDAQLKALLAGSLVPGPRVPGLRADRRPDPRPELASADVPLRAGAAAAR